MVIYTENESGHLWSEVDHIIVALSVKTIKIGVPGDLYPKYCYFTELSHGIDGKNDFPHE